MSTVVSLSNEKKLNITYLVEPGCLGPQGATLIEGFCEFAQSKMSNLDSEFVHWSIVPRYDKSLPEIQYAVTGKGLNQAQANKYLTMFDQNLDDYEGEFADKIASLIGEFAAR